MFNPAVTDGVDLFVNIVVVLVAFCRCSVSGRFQKD